MDDSIPLLTRHSPQHVTVLHTKHTIGSLAKATGYSKAHLSRILRCIEGPSDECLAKVAKALRVDKEKLRARLRTSRREEGMALRRAAREAAGS